MNTTGIKSSAVHDEFAASREGLLGTADKAKLGLVSRVGVQDQVTGAGGSRAGMVWSQQPSSGGVGAPPPPSTLVAGVRNPNSRTECEGRYGGSQEWNGRDGFDPLKNPQDTSKTLRMDRTPRDSPIGRVVMSPRDQRSREVSDGVISRTGSETHLSRSSSPSKPSPTSQSNSSLTSHNSPSFQHITSPQYEAPMKPKQRFIQGAELGSGSTRESPVGLGDAHRTPTPSGSHSSRAGSPNKYIPPPVRPTSDSPTRSHSTASFCGSPTRLGSSISRSGSPRRSTTDLTRLDSPTRQGAPTSRPLSPARQGAPTSRPVSPTRQGAPTLRPLSPMRQGAQVARPLSPTRLGSSAGRRESPTRLGSSVMRVESARQGGSQDPSRYSAVPQGEHDQSYYRGSPTRQMSGRAGSPTGRDGSSRRRSPVRHNPRQTVSPVAQQFSRNGSPFRQVVSRNVSPNRSMHGAHTQRIAEQSVIGPGRLEQSRHSTSVNSGTNGGRPLYRDSPKMARNSPSPHQSQQQQQQLQQLQQQQLQQQRRGANERKNKELDYRDMAMMIPHGEYERSLAVAAAAGQLIRPEYHPTPAMLLAAGYPPGLLVPGGSRTAGMPVHAGHFLPQAVLQHQQLQEQMRLFPQMLLRDQQAAVEVSRAISEGRRAGPDGHSLTAAEGHAAAAVLAQLEQLWQRKYPTHAVPPPWMLYQYQDELLRETSGHPSIVPPAQHPGGSAGSIVEPQTTSPRDPGSAAVRDRSREGRRDDGRAGDHGGAMDLGRAASRGMDVDRLEWERERRMREEQNEMREKLQIDRERHIERERMREKLTSTDREHLRAATMAAMDRRGAPWDPSRDLNLPRDLRRQPTQAPPTNIGSASSRPPSQSGSAHRESLLRGEAMSGGSASEAVNQHFEESLLRIGVSSQKVESAVPQEVSMPGYASNYPPGFPARGPEVPLVSPNPYNSDRVKIERQQNPAAMLERSRRPAGDLQFESRSRSPSAGPGGNNVGNSSSGRNPRQEMPTFNLYGYRPDVKYPQQQLQHMGMERGSNVRGGERVSPGDDHGKNLPPQEIPMLNSRGQVGEPEQGDMKSVIVDRRGVAMGGNNPSSGVMPAAYRGGGSITLGTAAYRSEGAQQDWQQRASEEALRAAGGGGGGQGKDGRPIPGGGSRPSSRHSTVGRQQDAPPPRFSPQLGGAEQQQHRLQQQQQQRWPPQAGAEPQRSAPPTNFSAEHLIERRDTRGFWEQSPANQHQAAGGSFPPQSRDRERSMGGTPTSRAGQDPSPVMAVQSSSINLILQGLVPNPLYSAAAGSAVSSHMMVPHAGVHQVPLPRAGIPPGVDPGAARYPAGGRVSPELDPGGNKRRNTGRKDAAGSEDIPDKKRLRYNEVGGDRYPDETGSYRYGTGLSAQDAGNVAGGQQGEGKSGASAGYIDSFKTFVDRTVQDAFYCPDLNIEPQGAPTSISEAPGVKSTEPHPGPVSNEDEEERRQMFESRMKLIVDAERSRSSPMTSGHMMTSAYSAAAAAAAMTSGDGKARSSSDRVDEMTVATEALLRNGLMENRDRNVGKNQARPEVAALVGHVGGAKSDVRESGLSSNEVAANRSQENAMTSCSTVQSNVDDSGQVGFQTVDRSTSNQPKNSNISDQSSAVATPPLSQSPPTSSITPPPGSVAGPSTSGHPYTKKAWLQRYSGQDTKLGPASPAVNDSSPCSDVTQAFRVSESVVTLASSSTADKKSGKYGGKKEEISIKKEELDIKREIKTEKLSKESVEKPLGFSSFRDSLQGVGATVVKSEPTSTSSDLEDTKSADSTGSVVQRKTRAWRNKDKAAAAAAAALATGSASSPASSSSKRSCKDSSGSGRGRATAADSPPMPKLVQEESSGNNSIHLADSSENVDSQCRSISSGGRLAGSRAGTPERPHLGGGGRGRAARHIRDAPSGIEQGEEEDEEQDEEQDLEEEEDDLEEPSKRMERRNKHKSDCETKLAQRDLINSGKTRDSPASQVEGSKQLSGGVGVGGGGRSTDKKRRRCNKEPFLQDGSCSELTPKLIKCRECKMSRTQRNKSTPNIFCRFFAFRKLRYSAKGLLTVSGFLRPFDADVDDISLWMPVGSDGDLQVDQAKYILSRVVSTYNKLVNLEKQSVDCLKQTCVAAAVGRKMAWKRALQGVKEMCDACSATLFNIHWACHKCGFAVCAQCFADRAIGCGEDSSSAHRKEATRDWLTCSANRQLHDLDSLMITQIIPSDVQTVIGRMLSEVLDAHNISISQSEASTQELAGRDLYEFTNGDSDSTASDESRPSRCSGSSSYGNQNGVGEGEKRRSGNSGVKRRHERNGETHDFDDDDDDDDETCPPPLKRLGADSSSSRKNLEGKRCTVRVDRILPHRVCGNAAVESPHRFLQDRKLLYLTDPLADNVDLFQKHWLRALPVLVADCTGTTAIPDLWTPDSFRREFAGLRADLVDCSTGAILRGQSTEKFWSGFEAACNIVGNTGVSVNSAASGNSGTGKQKSTSTGNSGTTTFQPVLRLKDWPAVDDPIGARWHRDLARTLPIREYTLPTGVFNLVSHLPEFFGRPELSVKIHAGYGSAAQGASVAFSRLHSSHADCVNILMYVEAPANETDAQKAALTKSLKEAGCCNVIKFLSGLTGKKVGAVWHIFRPQDGGKIKEFLAKQQQQSGRQGNSNSGWSSQKTDKCHSNLAGNGFTAEGGGTTGFDGQSWYLDRSLRARLHAEYDVQCCTVVQCLGDAVFIPALSPYQVKNLYSCISASKEFLSPESIDLCYMATQQLRQSSVTASAAAAAGHASDSASSLPLIDLLDNNQEEMLQVENVIFHAVKSSIAVLRESEET